MRILSGAATITAPVVSAGVELVRALGIADRGDAQAWVISGWGEARPMAHFAVDARFATVGYDAGGGRFTSAGGAFAVEPWKDHGNGRLRFWLALDRTSSSGSAMPLAGADPADATTLLLVASATAPFILD